MSALPDDDAGRCLTVASLDRPAGEVFIGPVGCDPDDPDGWRSLGRLSAPVSRRCVLPFGHEPPCVVEDLDGSQVEVGS